MRFEKNQENEYIGIAPLCSGCNCGNQGAQVSNSRFGSSGQAQRSQANGGKGC